MVPGSVSLHAALHPVGIKSDKLYFRHFRPFENETTLNKYAKGKLRKAKL